MAEDSKARRELTSWKEIASHLDVTVRTAQKWEIDRGLPIRRLPGARGRVSVYLDDLEEWKNPASRKLKEDAILAVPENGVTDGIVSAQKGRVSRLITLVGAISLVTGTAALTIYAVMSRPGPPAQARVEQSTLIVSDDHGREIWRKTFDKGLNTEQYSIRSPPSLPQPWFGDLDDDGRIETLFVEHSRSPHPTPTALVCFSETGVEKWRFVPGRKLSTPEDDFEPYFNIASFVVAPMGRKREKSVLVISFHFFYYPTQVTLLTSAGSTVREYFHSGNIGHFENVQTADLNGDGKSEIYLGGVSNAYDQATLVVLDPDTFDGASIEDVKEKQLLGFPPGKEIARILFPRSCMNQKLESYNVVNQVFTQAESLVVSVQERLPPTNSVLYHLTKDLRVMRVVLSDSFVSHHAQLLASGQLNHPLSLQEEATLRHIRILRPQVAHVQSATER
jgi:hypothetical protein